MINVLILNLYNNLLYAKMLTKNLDYYNIKNEIILYDQFDNIDFSRFSHIILTGSEYFITNNEIILNKEQIFTLLKLNKPILAQCYSFHLLAYHLVSKKTVKLFRKKEFGYFKINSPLVDKNNKYFTNHYNYISYLDDNWDIISSRKMRDLDSKNKTFIIDAALKEFNVLAIQYHPEVNKNTYEFIKNWVNQSK